MSALSFTSAVAARPVGAAKAAKASVSTKVSALGGFGPNIPADEYNKKMKEEIMEEGAPDRAFLLQAAAVGLGSFLFGLYGPKRKDD